MNHQSVKNAFSLTHQWAVWFWFFSLILYSPTRSSTSSGNGHFRLKARHHHLWPFPLCLTQAAQQVTGSLWSLVYKATESPTFGAKKNLRNFSNSIGVSYNCSIGKRRIFANDGHGLARTVIGFSRTVVLDLIMFFDRIMTLIKLLLQGQYALDVIFYLTEHKVRESLKY